MTEASLRARVEFLEQQLQMEQTISQMLMDKNGALQDKLTEVTDKYRKQSWYYDNKRQLAQSGDDSEGRVHAAPCAASVIPTERRHSASK